MPKAPKPGFYAVIKGRRPGVYLTWAECEAQVKGFAGAVYQKFSDLKSAEGFIGVSYLETSLTQNSIVEYPDEQSSSGASSSSVPPSSKFKPYTKPPLSISSPSKAAGPSIQREYTIVFTDGASKNNGNPNAVAGVGVYYGPNDSRNLAERCPGDQTNNRAELIAIVRALETEQDEEKPLLIKTDSKYCIDCLTRWLPNWVKNGWKTAQRKPVENQGPIKHLVQLLNERPGPVRIQHVFGHVGVEGNEGADRQANLGCFQSALPDRIWNDDPVTKDMAAKMSKMVLAPNESPTFGPTIPSASALEDDEYEDQFPMLTQEDIAQIEANNPL